MPKLLIIYCGENEYSIRPHKPNPVGATPTSATTYYRRLQQFVLKIIGLVNPQDGGSSPSVA